MITIRTKSKIANESQDWDFIKNSIKEDRNRKNNALSQLLISYSIYPFDHENDFWIIIDFLNHLIENYWDKLPQKYLDNKDLYNFTDCEGMAIELHKFIPGALKSFNNSEIIKDLFTEDRYIDHPITWAIKDTKSAKEEYSLDRIKENILRCSEALTRAQTIWDSLAKNLSQEQIEGIQSILSSQLEELSKPADVSTAIDLVQLLLTLSEQAVKNPQKVLYYVETEWASGILDELSSDAQEYPRTIKQQLEQEFNIKTKIIQDLGQEQLIRFIGTKQDLEKAVDSGYSLGNDYFEMPQLQLYKGDN